MQTYLVGLVPISGGSIDSSSALADRVVEAVNRHASGFTVSAGVGRVCHQVVDYAKSWHEAIECLVIIKRLGKTGQVLCFEQLGVLRLLKMGDR
ncbi:MAG: hypothetical protein Q7O66_06415, partial [Dehalococcoidia bacterium]|nr:hypothetical protein [Dehalococcoidia bacterium]